MIKESRYVLSYVYSDIQGNVNAVQDQAKKLLTKKTVSYLNPESSLSQFQRSRSFIDGLTQASESFRREFKITTRGMSRSYWAESSEALASVSNQSAYNAMLVDIGGGLQNIGKRLLMLCSLEGAP